MEILRVSHINLAVADFVVWQNALLELISEHISVQIWSLASRWTVSRDHLT